MKTVCELNKCAGCMACIDICPKGAIKIEDQLSVYNAVIQEDKCINCNMCHSVCQRNHPAETAEPIKWFQGWTEDVELRENCSSGGYATAISAAFIEAGGIVCSCVFRDGQFRFEFAENTVELKKFIGSKYVKSNPVGIYKNIKDRLSENQSILFIGLPCQIAALKKYVGTKLLGNLYTIDLICHGTPSPKLLDIFLQQYGVFLKEIKEIQFRAKAKFQIRVDDRNLVTKGVNDRYSIAFLNSLIYTENCYSCHYARKERVSDLTLGDSWGSELALAEQKKGVSLVLCQSEKGLELVKKANLHLAPVDINRAIDSNHQLKHPSVLPNGRKRFFKGIMQKRSFNQLVFQCLPKQCVRQGIKDILIKVKIIHR